MATITTTLTRLGDLKQPLQHKELRQLNDIGYEACAEFLTVWRTIAPERRREITVALTELAEDNTEFDFRDIFSTVLVDSDPEVRAAAVGGLWEDERVSTLRRLMPMLADDPDEHVRAAVAVALGRFAYRASLDELSANDASAVRRALLASASNLDLSDDIRRRAIESLGYFEGDDVTSLIGQAYISGRQPLKESALVAMGHNLDQRWLRVFDVELQSAEPSLCYEAARATGEFGSEAEALVPRLLPLAQGDDIEIAQAAIWALGQIGGDAAKRLLKRLKNSDDPLIQEAADEALSELLLGDESSAFF
jgi:HEAT repeat protein